MPLEDGTDACDQGHEVIRSFEDSATAGTLARLVCFIRNVASMAGRTASDIDLSHNLRYTLEMTMIRVQTLLCAQSAYPAGTII